MKNVIFSSWHIVRDETPLVCAEPNVSAGVCKIYRVTIVKELMQKVPERGRCKERQEVRGVAEVVEVMFGECN